MPAPYHVRLAVSQYGEQFRAELFTEDLEDTEGDLLTELPPSIAEWVPYLAQGADLPPDAARQLGKDLFAALLGQPENAKKWSEVLTQAARNKRPIRLLIDATTEAVRDLPYGLLCEPHDDWFLFRDGKKHSVEFVRILRRCSPRPLKLRDRLRVLIAIAEPKSADVPPFDAADRLKKLAAAVHKNVELIVCGPNGPKPLAEIAPNPDAADASAYAPYTTTTRKALRQALAGEYDVFHLLAHGHGTGVLLCNDDGSPAETTASELGEWCGDGRTSLAFLQVCKAGQTAGRGGFGGVAQQLLNPRGGNLAAVVASTFPLDAEHSTNAAVGFYHQLAAGKPPEEALTADRPETDWCWAFLELWARPGALGGTQQRSAFQFVSPYRGLSSFGEQDADLFFGRKSEVAELMQILRTEPALGVVGDSGSGKTSLLHAGLIHAIRREGLAGFDKWRIVTLRPGYRPAHALLSALAGPAAEFSPEALRTALRVDAAPLMVVFDQFEEIFTLARDKNEVQLLNEVLAEAVDTQRDRFRLVIGMRSEFLGQSASSPELNRRIRRPWVLRPPGANDMRDIVAGPAEHCGYTFQGPLNDGNPAHAVSLLDRILADPLLARGKDGSTAAPLPLLQFALERLWLKAVEKGVTEFTHAEYDDVGGMGKAIAQHAEAVYQASATATGFGTLGRTLAEQIITALVSSTGTRQPRVRDALQAEAGHPEEARVVVDYLVGERLLTIRSDQEDISKSLVDLSHEALIQNWDRLRGWLAEDPQGRAMREEFREAAEKWETGFAGAQARSRFALPGADVAANYLAWIKTSNPRLSPVQHEFAQAMRDMLARQRRRRRIVMASLGTLALVASGLSIFADIQARKARKSAADAQASETKAQVEKREAQIKSATLALEKGIQVSEEGRPRLGILSMAYALQLCPTDAQDLRRVILTNLASWGPHLMCLDDVHTLPQMICSTDPSGNYALLFRIVDKVYGGGVKLIPEFQVHEIDTAKPAGPAFQVEWKKPDGNLEFRYEMERCRLLPNGLALFTGSNHSSVWNTFTGKPLGKWIDHQGPGVAAVRHDGQLVACCDGRGNMRLFDAISGAPRSGVYPHMGKVNDLAFSRDGKYLVTGAGRRADADMDLKNSTLSPGDGRPEGVVHLYEVGSTASDPTKIKWSKLLPGIVTCVQISPDMKRVVGGGFELRSWDLASGDRLMAETRYSPESTLYIEFDPKSPTSYIACNPSGALQILHSGVSVKVSGERLSPQGWVSGVGYRDDGRVFTANRDGTVRIWNRPRHHDSTEVLGRVFTPPQAEAVLSVAFRHDGTAIALGSRSGIVYVYELDRTDPPKQFRCAYAKEQRNPVTHVAFSTDNQRIIAYDQMLRTYVFEASGDGTPLVAKNGLRPQGVAEDGRTAVFTSRTLTPYVISPLDPSVEVSTSPTFNPSGILAEHTDEAETWFLLRARRVAFNPDRTVVAMLNTEGMIHLFRTSDGEPLCAPIEHKLNGEVDGIHSVSFCSQGIRLLTRSPKAWGIWSAKDGSKVDYRENRIGIQVARFSPSGQLVLGGTNYSQGEAWISGNGDDAIPFPLIHSAQVWGVAADPKDERIITASFDHSARIWDRTTGRPLTPPLIHRLGVSEAVFSPDGAFALTGSWDGTARLWKVPKALEDEQERIEAWVETMTGLRISPTPGGELLNPDEWRKRKAQLDSLGGPPIDINH